MVRGTKDVPRAALSTRRHSKHGFTFLSCNHQDVTWDSAFPSVLLCFLFCLLFPFLRFFLWGGSRGEGESRLDGRTPHAFAGKCRLGTGFGRRLKASKYIWFHRLCVI